MKDRLRQAEGKLVFLATTTETINRTTEWLQQHLYDTVQALDNLLRQVEEKPQLGESHNVDVTQARSCVQKFRKEASARTRPWDEAKTRFLLAFPALGRRIFSRADNADHSATVMQNWVKERKEEPGAKLRDPGDAVVTQSGEVVQYNHLYHRVPPQDQFPPSASHSVVQYAHHQAQPHHPLPDDVPKFRFPETRQYAGSIGFLPVNHRQMRIHLNAQAYLPWDNPHFDEEKEAISRWEARHGVRFRPGCFMAEYDDGREGVRAWGSIML